MPSLNGDRYLKFAAERCYRTDQALPGYPGRRANWGWLAVGSSPAWGAKSQNRALCHLTPFLFCYFPGSNGAEFQTVRTASCVTRRPSRRRVESAPEATGAALWRVAAEKTWLPGSATDPIRWL